MPAPRSMLAPAASAVAGVVHLVGAIALRGAEVEASAMPSVLLGVTALLWAVIAVGSSPDRRVDLAGAAIGALAAAWWTVGAVRGAEEASALGATGALAAGLGLVVAVLCLRAVLGGEVSGAFASRFGVAAVVVVGLGGVAALPGSIERSRAEPPPEEQVVRVGGIVPFDPAEPIDLSGRSRATASEVAAAEALLAEVLEVAPAFAEPSDAEEAGYRSIDDAFTGKEHYLDWAAVEAGGSLDPERPEALVYEVGDDGGRTLVAFMFVRPPGTRVADAPEVGGPLTTWHAHGDLCVGDLDDGERGVVAITDAAGSCPEGSEENRPMPTLHAWVVAHPCGPFSEIEGVGTGAPAPGPEVCRTHRHGA